MTHCKKNCLSAKLYFTWVLHMNTPEYLIKGRIKFYNKKLCLKNNNSSTFSRNCWPINRDPSKSCKNPKRTTKWLTKDLTLTGNKSTKTTSELSPTLSSKLFLKTSESIFLKLNLRKCFKKSIKIKLEQSNTTIFMKSATKLSSPWSQKKLPNRDCSNLKSRKYSAQYWLWLMMRPKASKANFTSASDQKMKMKLA
jgi:hypothetical protein